MGVRQVRTADLAAAAVLTAVFAASLAWTPPDEGGFVLCIFNRITGLPCPGCGLTRSFCALGHGELARAAAFHPLGPAIYAAGLAYLARCVAALAGLGALAARFDAVFMRPRLALGAAGLLLGVWAARLSLLVYDGRIAGQARGGLLLRMLGLG
jgi:hypothetical protein